MTQTNSTSLFPDLDINAEALSRPAPAPTTPPRLRRPERLQGEFRDTCLDLLLPGDAPARLFWQYVESVDLAPLLQKIRAVEEASFRRDASLQECLTQAKAQVEALKTHGNDDAPATSEQQKQAHARAARERQERVEAAIAERAKLLAQREGQKRTNGAKFKAEELRSSTTDPQARRMKMVVPRKTA